MDDYDRTNMPDPFRRRSALQLFVGPLLGLAFGAALTLVASLAGDPADAGGGLFLPFASLALGLLVMAWPRRHPAGRLAGSSVGFFFGQLVVAAGLDMLSLLPCALGMMFVYTLAYLAGLSAGTVVRRTL